MESAPDKTNISEPKIEVTFDATSKPKKGNSNEPVLSFYSVDDALEYLATILVKAYFKQKKHERTK